jgi:hypothetical protein
LLTTAIELFVSETSRTRFANRGQMDPELKFNISATLVLLPVNVGLDISHWRLLPIL